MGGVHDPEEAAESVARGLTAAVHGGEQIPWLADAARRASGGAIPVHVEIDTGMHRMGVPPDDAVSLLGELHDEASLALEGVYTHLARAGSHDLTDSQDQLDRFQNLLSAARNRGVDPGIVHFASSAGLLVGSRLIEMIPSDAVRPGLLLYGVHTVPERVGELRPVMTLRTRVIALRTLHKGESVGYEATFRATRDTRIATLPVGYGDGIPLSASNRATVLIGGQRLPVVGRTSMDYITIDVARAAVSVGDEAILFGEGQGARLPIEEAAAAADTIAYELLVRVGSRVPRVIED
jgi:alanine racemase